MENINENNANDANDAFSNGVTGFTTPHLLIE
jgi:hypothetical protein